MTPWAKGEAQRAAVWAFKRWLETRGGTGSHEENQAIEQVRLMMVQHGEARFECADGSLLPFGIGSAGTRVWAANASGGCLPRAGRLSSAPDWTPLGREGARGARYATAAGQEEPDVRGHSRRWQEDAVLCVDLRGPLANRG